MDFLASLFVKQPRADYHISDLGPARFALWRPGTASTAPRRLEFQREDFVVLNERGHAIQASFFSPLPTRVSATVFAATATAAATGSDPTDPPAVDGAANSAPSQDARFPVVLYAHGNASCRADALIDAVGLLLRYECGVVALDFSACGHSGGDYSSLGFREPGDLEAVWRYLARTHAARVASVALWGRSMGAVAALRCAARWAVLGLAERRARFGDVPLTGLILDSPFAQLWSLAQHIVSTSSIFA